MQYRSSTSFKSITPYFQAILCFLLVLLPFTSVRTSTMAATTALKYLTVPATTKHSATVVFAHGLGDTGHGWKQIAEMFKHDYGLSHVKWVLPHSPTARVTANMGMVMPSWFDIYSFGFDTAEDENGMLSSARLLNDLISAEVDAGIDSSRIVIGGFSQGGAMSLLTGLTSERKLGGVAVLSGWLALHQKFNAMMSDHAKSIPIFWGHGTSDPLVKYDLGLRSVDHLTKSCGVPEAKVNEVSGIRFLSYEGLEHSSCPQELDDLKSWLKAVIPKEETRL